MRAQFCLRDLCLFLNCLIYLNSILFISQFLFTECNDMSTARKDVIAYASIIDPALCDGVVVKLITTQSTEQVCKT